jgi:hypothetical protein
MTAQPDNDASCPRTRAHQTVDVLQHIKIGSQLAFPRSAVRAIVLGRTSGRDLTTASVEVISRRPDLAPAVRRLMQVLAKARPSARSPAVSTWPYTPTISPTAPTHRSLTGPPQTPPCPGTLLPG